LGEVGESRLTPHSALTAIDVPRFQPDDRVAISNTAAVAFVSLFRNRDIARCVPGASVGMHAVLEDSKRGTACTESRNTGDIDGHLYRDLCLHGVPEANL
jgi:hypothetical protein